MAPLVYMLRKALFDMRYFMLIFFLMALILSMTLSVLGIDNA